MTFDPNHNPCIPLTYSKNRVRWTASDEKHGNFAEGTIHEDFAVHFSDKVTTLCKAGGSPVPQSAQGTIKPTAHSTHGHGGYKDRGKVVGQQGVLVVLLPLIKGICHFSWQEQDCSALFWTNHSIYDPWSNTVRFISSYSNHGSWRPVCLSETTLLIGRDKAYVVQKLRPVRVMCELVTRSKMKSVWKTEKRGSSKRQVKLDVVMVV